MRRQSMSRVTGGVHCTPDWNMSTCTVQYSTVLYPGTAAQQRVNVRRQTPNDLEMHARHGKGASTNLDADTRGSICGVEISSEAE